MPRDERLKKRTSSVPHSKKNDTRDPENGFNRNGGHQVGTQYMQGSAARSRRRYKGSKSRNWIFVRRLKRFARNCSSQKGTRRRGVVSSTSKTVTFLLCFIVAFFMIIKNGGNASNTATLRNRIKKRESEFKISFSNTNSVNFSQPFFQIDPIESGSKENHDYGGLKLADKIGNKRQISDLDVLSVTDFRPPEWNRDDDGNDAYVAFDDDFLRGTEGTMNQNPTGKVCHRTSNHRVSYQNCNSIYELELLNNNVKYLNAGSYRQVFSLQHSFEQENELIAVKDMFPNEHSDAGSYEFVRMDAMVAERLTSSPRIYDIYGFCGLSVLSEYFPHGDIEDVAVAYGTGYLLTEDEQDEYLDGLEGYNDLSEEEKLVMSLQMAESIADLHGHETGVIVHQDIQLGQFLYNADKSLVKLNDFNRAEFMLFDEKGKDYCKYGEGAGHGNWRSPEEYFDYDLDEQVDVFSLGNNMYSVLTGLWPFYDVESDKVSINRVKNGVKPYIDPGYKHKSIAERKLAEIIEQCFAFQPEDRPSIFEIVEFLRDALREVREHADSEQVKN